MKHFQPQHGMMLTELLFVLSILGVVMVLEAQLFNASIRTIGALPSAQAQAGQLSQMTEMLRRDVWSASRIDQPDERRITLAEPDGASISWDFTSQDRISRSTTQPSQNLQWDIHSAPLPTRTNTGLLLENSTDRRPMFNQAMILTEQTR